MGARKDKIKELNATIKKLEEQIEGHKVSARHAEKRHARTRSIFKEHLSYIQSEVYNVRARLKFAFVKDLTWMELTDNAPSKFTAIKETRSDLHSLATYAESLSNRIVK